MFVSQVAPMSKKFINDTANEELLFPVVAADRLLKQAGHQKLLQKIQKEVAQHDDRYYIIYEPLIHQFVEYTQILRDVGKRSNEQLMNVGLERAYYIASQYVKDHQESADFVYVYALFSLALLLDVGRVDFGRAIHVCNKSGVFLKEWTPIICGSLIDEADFIKIRETVSYSEKLANAITPLLAQKIVPDVGFICLSGQPDLLASWLSVLARDDSGNDTLSTDMKMYNKQFYDHRTKMLQDVLIEGLLIDGLQAGEAFWKWLKEGLKDKTISVNEKNSKIHKVAGGLFIDYKALAKDFSSIYGSKFPNWVVVSGQFNSMGIAKLSGHDYKFDQFFGKSNAYGLGGMFSAGGAKSGKIAGSVKSPDGLVIDDMRKLVSSSGYKNSSYLSSKGGPSDAAALASRAESVYGVNNKQNKGLDPNQ